MFKYSLSYVSLHFVEGPRHSKLQGDPQPAWSGT